MVEFYSNNLPLQKLEFLCNLCSLDLLKASTFIVNAAFCNEHIQRKSGRCRIWWDAEVSFSSVQCSIYFLIYNAPLQASALPFVMHSAESSILCQTEKGCQHLQWCAKVLAPYVRELFKYAWTKVPRRSIRESYRTRERVYIKYLKVEMIVDSIAWRRKCAGDRVLLTGKRDDLLFYTIGTTDIDLRPNYQVEYCEDQGTRND